MPTTGSPSRPGDENFCQMMRHDDSVFPGAEASAGTPARLKKAYADEVAALDAAGAVAPPAIKSDFVVIVELFKAYRDAVAAAHFDPLKVSPAVLAQIESPSAKTAATRVENYLQRVCKVTLTPIV
jgi:hypothetical protein